MIVSSFFTLSSLSELTDNVENEETITRMSNSRTKVPLTESRVGITVIRAGIFDVIMNSTLFSQLATGAKPLTNNRTACPFVMAIR